MEGIKQYLLTLTAAAIICTSINVLLKSKVSVYPMIKLLTGTFMALCTISPLLQVNRLDLGIITSQISEEASVVAHDGEEMSAVAMIAIIKERAEAYILDKAEALGLELKVEVQMSDLKPLQLTGVIYQGTASPYAKKTLEQYVKDTLGIAREDQVWK